MGEHTVTQHIESCLARLQAGDREARNELINVACGRLESLTRKMLGGYSRLRGYEQTGDVLQNALIRLCGALEKLSPENPQQFFGLAALQIRRELIDMSRSYFGRGESKPGRPIQAEGEEPMPDPAAESTLEPSKIIAWTDFHKAVESLPEKEREAVDLLWYQELPQQEAADLLGVDKSTVKRRWRSARLMLGEALSGWFPK